MTASPQHAEAIFAALATALDAVPAGQAVLFLSKLCLLLALDQDRPDHLTVAIGAALQDLPQGQPAHAPPAR